MEPEDSETQLEINAASVSPALLSTAGLSLELPLSPQNAQPKPFSSSRGDDLDNNEVNLESLLSIERSSSLFHRELPTSGSSMQIFAFGRGDQSSLGNGSTEDSATPIIIEALTGKDIVSTAAGTYHAAAITSDGELYTWGGFNENGECGQRDASGTPQRLQSLENFRTALVACGQSHTLAVTEDGSTVFGFGNAEYGQLGLPNVTSTKVPKIIHGLSKTRIARISAGGNHSMALSTGGSLYTFGEGGSDTPALNLRMWPLGVSQIAAGEGHSALLTVSGHVYTFGRGKSGQLGLGDFSNQDQPKLVTALRGIHVGQISCGDNHTVALTSQGYVYSCGNGTWGATGLSCFGNICSPQLIRTLSEEYKICQVAAGGRHTLFLSTSGVVLSCGDNEFKQLGYPSDAEKCAVPKPVQGLPLDGKPLFVCAGADYSFVAIHRGKPRDDDCSSAGIIKLDGGHGDKWQALQVPKASEIITLVKEGKLLPLYGLIERVFSNPAYLLDSFDFLLAASPLAATTTGENAMDIDGGDKSSTNEQLGSRTKVAEIASLWSRITTALQQCQNEAPVQLLITNTVSMFEVLETYLQQMFGNKSSVVDDQHITAELSWMPRLLFILLLNPLNALSTAGGRLLLGIARLLSSTIPAGQRLPIRNELQNLLQQLPAAHFGGICRAINAQITRIVDSGRFGPARLELMMLGVLLDVLREANEERQESVSYAEFSNAALSDAADWQSEYVAWMQHRNREPPALVSFCQLPFLLTPEAKSRILHGEAMVQKRHHMTQHALQAFFNGMNPSEAGFLKLKIRRTHILEDALNGLVYNADDLKKPMRVTFISEGVAEPAQDEGGVTKEFFQLISHELFDASYGMFVYDQSTRQYWFNPASLESETEFALVGALLGLAIYNGVLLDVRFPLALYSKLLGNTPTFKDLKHGFPELAKGLQSLLDYTPAEDVESMFSLNFTAEYEFYGHMKTTELVPGGAEMAVNGFNRSHYVEAYTQWYLTDSVKEQFESFRKGFMRVCGGPSLSLFTPAELELLICGLPHLNMKDLEKAARYEGGYTKDSQEIKWFWEIIHEMSIAEHRAFLRFTTGSDRAPVGGLSKLQICIQKEAATDWRLPSSHTCFNILLLPQYSTKDKLKEKLMKALSEATTGFGLT